MKYVIGIDLGGTNIRGAAVSLDGKILSREKIFTEVKKGKEQVVKNLLTLISHLRESMEGKVPLSIGLGVPGIILTEEGIVVKSPNFPDWVNYNLKADIERGAQTSVVIENDANAAALGEGWAGAGKGEDHFCVLTLGTGIGGGVVLNGKIWRGAVGMAGELGHINIYPDGRPCGCGSRGCMEQYASASGIVKEALSEINSAEGEKLKEAIQDHGGTLSARLIFSQAESGDKYSQKVLKKAGQVLGIGITDLLNILNVEIFIIGGGASEAWPFFIDPLKEEIKERAYEYTGDRVKIRNV